MTIILPPPPPVIAMKMGEINGNDVMSPSRPMLWKNQILTSQCNKCPPGAPEKNCTCGIYCTFYNGWHELINYAYRDTFVCFVGKIFGAKWQRYQWGARAGQFAVIGLVNWHGEVYKPGQRSPIWWENTKKALSILKDAGVTNPRIYTTEEVSEASQISLSNYLAWKAEKQYVQDKLYANLFGGKNVE